MTSLEQWKAVERWHPWFAWHPVRITGTHTAVWLERIERRLESSYACNGAIAIYRLPVSEDAQ